jgi:8-oxo-dGTP pyrophosphatase MutT (NUDIX family)
MNNTSAGIFFYSQNTNRYLYLLRNDPKNNNNWGLPGGKIEDSETLLEGLVRECEEEIGFFPNNGKLIPIQKFVNNNFVYHTFFCIVENEFIPILNSEHSGYAWVVSGQYPKPLHPGVFNMINFEVVKDKLFTLTKKAP